MAAPLHLDWGILRCGRTANGANLLVCLYITASAPQASSPLTVIVHQNYKKPNLL